MKTPPPNTPRTTVRPDLWKQLSDHFYATLGNRDLLSWMLIVTVLFSLPLYYVYGFVYPTLVTHARVYGVIPLLAAAFFFAHGRMTRSALQLRISLLGCVFSSCVTIVALGSFFTRSHLMVTMCGMNDYVLFHPDLCGDYYALALLHDITLVGMQIAYGVLAVLLTYQLYHVLPGEDGIGSLRTKDHDVRWATFGLENFTIEKTGDEFVLSINEDRQFCDMNGATGTHALRFKVKPKPTKKVIFNDAKKENDGKKK
jgi:hypothetical protein